MAKRMALLPDRSDICSWWFNPDSSRWQLTCAHETGLSYTRGENTGACFTELYQASADGMTWRLIASDTGFVEMEGACGFGPPRSITVSREPTLSLEERDTDVRSDMIEVLDNSIGITRDFVHAVDENARGFEMRYVDNVDSGPRTPLYWVDRNANTRTLLLGPSESDSLNDSRGFDISAACGYLLVSTYSEPAQLFDLRTGRKLPARFGSSSAQWVPIFRSR